ncbi:acid protease [Aspergillus avenaceus]|uniref:Acid protease n=1 Tax=Aspergillus avenaceus TaxID=36643 RepID=A0A5N6TR25_ASPAV|nr:acid protease [Aspergillus avenaceus]
MSPAENNLEKVNGISESFLYETSFYANITVGTPPRPMRVLLSLWHNACYLDALDSRDCFLQMSHKDCGPDGGYNASKSSSSRFTASGFTLDDEDISGKVFNDTLTIGDATLDTFPLHVITDPNHIVLSNTLGLGYTDSNSSSLSLPRALADAGIINSTAFSFWTGPGGYSYNGTILFGGVNKAKYVDPLHTVPMVPDVDGLRKALRANMTNLSIMGVSPSPDPFPLDAAFDNQASLTYVPEAVARPLFKHFNITDIPNTGQVKVPCDMVSSNTTLIFEFGSVKLPIPVGYFVRGDSPYEYEYYQDTCFSGIAVNKHYQHKGSIVLGTNFMRIVYMVFDLDNDEVSFAWRNESGPDNILEITSGKGSVPGATISTQACMI